MPNWSLFSPFRSQAYTFHSPLLKKATACKCRLVASLNDEPPQIGFSIWESVSKKSGCVIIQYACLKHIVLPISLGINSHKCFCNLFSERNAWDTVPFWPDVQSLVTSNPELNTRYILSWVTRPIEQCTKEITEIYQNIYYNSFSIIYLKSGDIVLTWMVLDVPLLVVVLALSNMLGVASQDALRLQILIFF